MNALSRIFCDQCFNMTSVLYKLAALPFLGAQIPMCFPMHSTE